jgi:hypothetical protein
MTVPQLFEQLHQTPRDAVVLMDNGAGLSRVAAPEQIEDEGPGAPATVILSPSMDK